MITLAVAVATSCSAFSTPSAAVLPAPRRAPVITAMAGEEGKGAIGGAVLGGLLAGPFGALWGAQIGGAVGANNRANREQTEQLGRMGLSKDIMQLAQQTAEELKQAEESLAIVSGAERSQRNLIASLEESMASAYASAESALRSGDEAAARTFLESRQQAKAKKTLAEEELASAMQRVASMRASVDALAERANGIEQQVSRIVSASRSAPRGDDGAPVIRPPEDPLEKRFRDLEK